LKIRCKEREKQIELFKEEKALIGEKFDKIKEENESTKKAMLKLQTKKSGIIAGKTSVTKITSKLNINDD
jgi:hypothetical protein